MHLVDNDGRTLDAEYLIEADGGYLALIMESRSGMSGRRAPRNPDYNRALTVLLARLGMLSAVLIDAVVDSRYTQDLGLPEAARRLIQAPIRLALEPDADALRRHLGTAQTKIAQAPDATKGVIRPSASGSALMFPVSGRATQPAWRRHSRRPSSRAPRRGLVTGGSATLARTYGWR